jgi:hypothetical protein
MLMVGILTHSPFSLVKALPGEPGFICFIAPGYHMARCLFFLINAAAIKPHLAGLTGSLTGL